MRQLKQTGRASFLDSLSFNALTYCQHDILYTEAFPDGSSLHLAAGGAASSTTPLDTMANGQVTSVAASELSSSRQTGREQGLVGQSMQGTFKPLSGRKLKFV